MPLELPRHELQVRKKESVFDKKEYEYAERYDEVEQEARKKEKAAGRDTKNPEKRTARSATSIVADAQKSLNAATAHLTKTGTVPINDLVSELRGRAKESSTDLAGYFNDYKLSLEKKDNLSKLDVQLFELLEFAERKGGIGHWLEQWNALMRDPAQRTDVSKMADIADSIGAGIEFQKALLEENFSKDPERLRTIMDEKVKEHLNSLAFEISRQVTEALQGRFETASPLSAARNTLKGEDPREGKARAIQQAVKNLSVSQLFEGQQRRDRQVKLDKPDPVVKSLQKWEEAATDMSALVETIGGPDYPGDMMEKSVATRLMDSQLEAMNRIRDAASQIFNETPSRRDEGITDVVKDVTLFQLSGIASALLEQHRAWATQLKNPGTKQKLLDQVELAKNIRTVIEKKRQDPENKLNLYEQALTASENGSLHDMWKAVKNRLLDSVRSCGADAAVKELEQLFELGLGDDLDKWAIRRKSPQDIRGLAWQLISTLREYQAGAEKILEKHETSMVGGAASGKEVRRILEELLDHSVGAIRGAVAQGLDENIAAGLV
jgi:hypothetical protein